VLQWHVWREQIVQRAVQPLTELFQEVQADILLAHLDPMQRGFRNPKLPREVPVCSVASTPSYLLC
jgi:hypothetical protein